ncbi:radical SAM protein [Tissierella carlieri]|uniref:radical SAM protein n=1 Tax=Tissierella carlieri TaxID=689904 RepID=UPI002804BA0A|nr:radical SAM protein [uncultured Tissierella sp.]MDU5080194.1 radical SAM protein [Bacillota bacterium]
MKGLSIHLTDQCNQSCKFCVVDSYQERKENVNKRIIYKFLEGNRNKGYEVVNIHGGEPTIVPEFLDILARIKELGYPQVSLQTNGRTLKDFHFAKQLSDYNVNTFVISFHNTDKMEIADLANVNEEWLGEIIQGIKNAKAVGSRVRTNTVVYRNNLRNLCEIMKFIVGELDVDHINISAMHPAGRAYKNFYEVVPRYTEIIEPVMEAVDYVIKTDKELTLEGFPPCLLGEYKDYLVDWYDTDFKLLYHNFILNSYADFMSQSTKSLGTMCNGCNYSHDRLCGGIYKEYIEKYGWHEFSERPIAEVNI